jgi:hypothetical protein
MPPSQRSPENLPGFDELVQLVLATPPFAGAPEHNMWDHRSNPPRPYPCQDHAQLVKFLASALYELERRDLDSHLMPGRRQAQTRQDLTRLKQDYRDVLRGRAAGTLSAPATATIRGIRPASVEQAWELLARVTLSPTPADYRRFNAKPWREVRQTLDDTMCQAFANHGPNPFPNAARDYALALILIHCTLEDGTPERVVARLRDRRRKQAKRRGQR